MDRHGVRTDRLFATRCTQTAAPIGQHAAAILAGVGGRDREHLTPGARCTLHAARCTLHAALAFEDGPKRCPARIADALGLVVVTDQIRNPHIFNIDYVVLLQQRQRALMLKVPPLALHRLMVALAQGDGLAAMLAALLAASHLALSPGETPLSVAVMTRVLDDLPIGGDEEHLHPNVNASL
jgi:hypothetical protein